MTSYRVPALYHVDFWPSKNTVCDSVVLLSGRNQHIKRWIMIWNVNNILRYKENFVDNLLW